jgi:capsular exopolysaccharide synthesis family protein
MLPLDPQRGVPVPSALALSAEPAIVDGEYRAQPVPPALSADSMGTALVQALKRRWLSALLVGLLAGVLAAAVTWWAMPTEYTAVALVHVASQPPSGLFVKNDSREDFASYQRTQATLLKSKFVLKAAMRQPQVKDLSEIRDNPDVDAWLAKYLLVDTTLGPEILRVSLTGQNADHLPLIVNAIVQAYIDEVAAKEKIAYKGRVDLLQENYRQIKDGLRRQRQMVRDLEVSLGVDDPQTALFRYQSALQQLTEAQKEQRQTTSALRNAELELAADKNHDERTPVEVTDLAIEEFLKSDASYQKLKTRADKLEEDIEQTRSLAAPAVREQLVQEARDQLASAQRSMNARRREVRPLVETQLRRRGADDRRNNRAKLESLVPVQRDQLKGLDQEIQRLKDDVQRLGKAISQPGKPTSDLENLRDEVAQKDQFLKKLGDQLATFRVEPELPARATLLEPAEVPQVRNLDRPIKMAALAGLAMCGLGVVGVGWREYRCRKVYAVDDVVRGLGMSLVGTLPALPTTARRPRLATGTADDRHWQALLAEAVDAIRTQLLHAAQRDSLRVVMVSSALGGEGKTSLASHLAASLARAGRKTLLIDGDLRNPGLNRQFHVPLEPGFGEVLRGEVKAEEAIQPIAGTRLALLPAGRWTSEAIQALAQNGIRPIFDMLKGQFDFLLLDSSPVLPVADALLLGQHVDAVILSVLRDVSRLPSVHAARQRLTTLGIRVLGTVVIGADDEVGKLGYQYPQTVNA